jgi:tetratricopeptide (TPR) repeat protein
MPVSFKDKAGRDIGEVLFERAEEHRKSAEYGRAIKLYKRALNSFKKKSDVSGILNSYLSLGDTLRAKGGFTTAKTYYEEGLKLAEVLNERNAEADALVGLGLSLRALGDWSEALDLINKANRLYRSLNDRRGEAFSAWAKAGTYRIKGDIKQALKNFDSALRKFRVLKDRSGIAYSYCGLGGPEVQSFKRQVGYSLFILRTWRMLESCSPDQGL